MVMGAEQVAKDPGLGASAKEAHTHRGEPSVPADKKEGRSFDELPRTLGRYVLLKRIARGGMGEVFLASTTGLEGAERPVVVKIIRREHAKDPSFIARFLDEARVQAQLVYSGVAQVLDAAIDDRTGEPYAVVEYVEGRSLGDVRSRAVQTGQSIGWASAVAISTLIAEALAHIHERKDASGRSLAIVHRDLSPQNVMVSFTGDVKIIDFGTARGQNRRCHTVAGVVFAKPGYVAPEVANGDPGDARVDIYALGVMLWELCAGRRFLQGDAGVHTAAVAQNRLHPGPIAESIGAPVELDAIIAKLCAFEREARYASARTAASDLAKLLGNSPSLVSGERGARARVGELLSAFFPGEPERSRKEFERLVSVAREHKSAQPTPKIHAPSAQGSRPAAPKEPNQLAGTRYRLLGELGRGACSVVYEAEHIDLGRRVALKVLSEGRSRSEEFSARFRREARALSKLEHPGLVKVYDFGEAENGRLFCAMERLEGETLEAYLEREKMVEWRVALELGDKILCALEAAHAAEVIHRDVKPSNLFLTNKGELKILDFGLAKGPESFTGSSFATSRTGFTLFGTPEYMAPEQAAAGQVDARADIYALGCILYELITGKLPFPGDSAVAILAAKVKGSPERPRERAGARSIPEAVDTLVMRALSRHPSLRFQSATEMRAAIRAALSSDTRRTKGRKLMGYATSVGAVLVLAGALFAAKGRALRSAVPFLRAPAGAEQAGASAAADEASLEPLDQGDDGDMVDDTPGAPSGIAMAPPSEEPASAAAPAAATATDPAAAAATDPAAAAAADSASDSEPASATDPAGAVPAIPAAVAVAPPPKPVVRARPRKRAAPSPSPKAAAVAQKKSAPKDRKAGDAAKRSAPKAVAAKGHKGEARKPSEAGKREAPKVASHAGHAPKSKAPAEVRGSEKSASPKADKAHASKNARLAKTN